MKDPRTLENTPRVIAVALAFFGGLALLGWTDGVFTRFERDELVALAIFAAGFIALTAWLDTGVRALVAQAFNRARAGRKSAIRRPAIS